MQSRNLFKKVISKAAHQQSQIVEKDSANSLIEWA